ncbi:MAG: 1-phosphofructokinase family hexose kinase [Gulosibacter sp.]|uniref:1-phosphofructokinase family hexose kinase n=1 Tax=Gulosibacter sp. TaxID=2817531 RepID=UPI003F8F7CE7
METPQPAIDTSAANVAPDAPLSSVVTVTPAPAIDRVIRLDSVSRGCVNRAPRAEHFLGGNGVNLARALSASGNATVAIAPLHVDAAVASQLRTPGVQPIAIRERTRMNTVIIEPDGTTTNINEPAATLSASEWASLWQQVEESVRDLNADWLSLGGAIPSGSDGPWIGDRLNTIARQSATRLVLDMPSATLREWLNRGVRPNLIAPNLDELRELTGRRIPTLGAAVDAAFSLVRQGVEFVLVTLGAHGLVLVSRRHQLWARTAPVRPVNTTGAGDATLAGLLSEWRGEHSPARMRQALTKAARFGRAAVLTTGPTINPEVVPSVPVDISEPIATVRLER